MRGAYELTLRHGGVDLLGRPPKFPHAPTMGIIVGSVDRGVHRTTIWQSRVACYCYG